MNTKTRKVLEVESQRHTAATHRSHQNLGILTLVVAVFLLMMALSFSIFGARSDRAKFTTEVTPMHVQVGSVAGNGVI